MTIVHRGTLVLIVLALAMIASAVVVVAQETNVINACVKRNGQATIVDAGAPCKKNETPLSWSITGPTGPPGRTG